MTTPQSIIIFSTADWDTPFWTNKQHMACQFAQNGYKVLYVDSLGLRKPSLKKRDAWRIWKRLCKSLPLPRQVQPNIWRVSPFVLPWHANATVRACNDFLLRATIRYHLRALGMERPLIWTYNPVIADLCVTLPNCGIIYHCVDDLKAAPRIDATTVEKAEEKLGAVADLCFVTSPHLVAQMEPLFPKVIYEPNVCDPAFFTVNNVDIPEPLELRDIPHPRLLFVGALSDYKVDFRLMEGLARRLPRMHWVLIGAVGEGQPDSQGPPLLPNVHQLGPMPYNRLPEFMKHCDLAAMPFARNAYTDSMSPMKFFESLAAGLPVVATRLPALKEFETLYFAADDEASFAAHLQYVIDGERRDQDAIQLACDYYSWTSRFKRMQVAIDEVVAHCSNFNKNGSPQQHTGKEGAHCPTPTSGTSFALKVFVLLRGLFCAHLVYPIAEKSQKRSISPKLAVLRQEAALPFAGRKKLALARLADILEHAGRTVPYYRDLFTAQNFHPEKVRTDARYLEDLPYLTKDIVREQGRRLISEPYVPLIVREQKTGGSTGLSATIFYDQEGIDWTAAQNILVLNWGGKRRHDREAHLSTKFASLTKEQVRFEAKKCFALNRYNIYTGDFSDEAQEQLLDDLQRANARIVQGHPSSLFALAKYLQTHQWQKTKLFEIFVSTGEMLSPKQRETIENTLGVRISNRYGACEFGVMAQELAEGPRGELLVSDSLVWPEAFPFVDGNLSELAFTNLRNKAMPLIRYRMGDLGKLEKREDGWWISELTGRTHDRVEIDGAVYPTHYIMDILDRCGPVSDFQILTRDGVAAEMRLVTPIEHWEEVKQAVYGYFPTMPIKRISAGELVFTGIRGKFSYLLREAQ